MEVDAVTNTTDETLTECNAVSERIMLAAGPELKEEIITRALGNYPPIHVTGCFRSKKYKCSSIESALKSENELAIT